MLGSSSWLMRLQPIVRIRILIGLQKVLCCNWESYSGSVSSRAVSKDGEGGDVGRGSYSVPAHSLQRFPNTARLSFKLSFWTSGPFLSHT